MSRLVDSEPDGVVQQSLDKFSQKQLKLLHVFEVLHPLRSEEEIEKEVSEDVKKLLDEAEGKTNEEPSEKPAIEAAAEGATVEEGEKPRIEVQQEVKEPEKVVEDDDDLPDFAPAKIEDEARDELKPQVEVKDEDDLNFEPLKKEDLSTAEQIMAAQEKLMDWYKKLCDFKTKLLSGTVSKPVEKVKTKEDHIKEEKKKNDDEIEKMKLPAFVACGKLEKTSWGMMILGSYKQTMETRKRTSIDRTTEAIEIEAKLQSRTKACVWNCFSFIMYAWVTLVILSMAVPAVTIAFFREQIKGGDFVNIESPVNLTNITLKYEKPLIKETLEDIKKKQEELTKKIIQQTEDLKKETQATKKSEGLDEEDDDDFDDEPAVKDEDWDEVQKQMEKRIMEDYGK